MAFLRASNEGEANEGCACGGIDCICTLTTDAEDDDDDDGYYGCSVEGYYTDDKV